ncbi:Putative uncharacterized protein [Escherichia coli D6-117.29]|nr:Protein of unknown function [Escherichia coli D6-113.11]CDP74121.1 Protein of unknown function [Escherichia coli]CDP75615.1 Putative uncharacterized protein [Escherichia coli D6-117.29]CDU33955.1 Protein of unknown function [Escherichia coli D6-113.11]CDU41312.1 Protein of unknown function [Escherichia coli]
MDRLTPGKRQ